MRLTICPCRYNTNQVQSKYANRYMVTVVNQSELTATNARHVVSYIATYVPTGKAASQIRNFRIAEKSLPADDMLVNCRYI